jgi:hypothetical protein
MSEEDKKTVTAEAKKTSFSFTAKTASVSYVSGFPKKQLEFAKIARDRSGEIEAKFDGSEDKIPEMKKRVYQESVISTVVNSLAFLEGQKDWFKKRIEEGKWNIDESKLHEEYGDGLEDSLAKTAENIKTGESQINGSRPYQEIKVLRRFRNSLLHFDSEKVRAGKEGEKFNAHSGLEEQDFPENKFESNNTYPFNWLTYEMAERSVRMSFDLWRSFAKELGKEDEFLNGVPRP